MSELSSKFGRDDLETLIEAIGDWELLGNQEFNFLQMIEGSPMPPEDHEAFETFKQIKQHYREKKQDIVGNRAMRQEKAVFLKAKLMMVRRDMQITDLFEMASDVPVEPESPPKRKPPVADKDVMAPMPVAQVGEMNQKLSLAEFFIKDLGVWEHYLKFLKEKSGENSTN